MKAVDPIARWRAANLVAGLMSDLGTVAVGRPCPQCEFGIHYVHFSPNQTLEPLLDACECIRCGATWLFGDQYGQIS